jgi:hypothetical protein
MVIRLGVYYISLWIADFGLFNCDNGFILLFIFLTFGLPEGSEKKNLYNLLMSSNLDKAQRKLQEISVTYSVKT